MNIFDLIPTRSDKYAHLLHEIIMHNDSNPLLYGECVDCNTNGVYIEDDWRGKCFVPIRSIKVFTTNHGWMYYKDFKRIQNKNNL